MKKYDTKKLVLLALLTGLLVLIFLISTHTKKSCHNV